MQKSVNDYQGQSYTWGTADPEKEETWVAWNEMRRMMREEVQTGYFIIKDYNQGFEVAFCPYVGQSYEGNGPTLGKAIEDIKRQKERRLFNWSTATPGMAFKVDGLKENEYVRYIGPSLSSSERVTTESLDGRLIQWTLKCALTRSPEFDLIPKNE